MLAITPRMRARIARKHRKAERRRLRFKDHAGLVRALVAVTTEARDAGRIVTAFAYEASFIAILRAELCLRSIPWARADAEARAVVGEALDRMGAKRPTWAEGQPEHTDGGVIREIRTECIKCGEPLVAGQRMYCGKLCAQAEWHRRHRLENLDKMLARERLRSFRRRVDGRR